jgi:hypothetical protein
MREYFRKRNAQSTARARRVGIQSVEGGHFGVSGVNNDIAQSITEFEEASATLQTI